MATVADDEYLAAFNADTGDFVDLVRSDASTLSFRVNEDWQEYQPGDFSLDGSEIIEVEQAFTNVVDKAFAARSKPTREQAAKYSVDGRLA